MCLQSEEIPSKFAFANLDLNALDLLQGDPARVVFPEPWLLAGRSLRSRPGVGKLVLQRLS